jgi:hypothetical protein
LPEQHDRLAGGHVGAGGEVGQGGRGDAVHGVHVELGQPLEARELGLADAAGAAALAAVVDLGGEDFGEVAEVGLAFPHRDLGQPVRFGPDGG